jgi:hypothetical protein
MQIFYKIFEHARAKALPNSLIKRGVYNGKHNPITKENTLPASNHPTFSPPREPTISPHT